jgi:hypothetical protein
VVLATSPTITTPTISGALSGNATSGGATSQGNNFVMLTADWTDASSAALQTISGFTFTLPASLAQNVPFACHIMYTQATQVSDSFGVQSATYAPTRIDAYGTMSTGGVGVGAPRFGVLTDLTTTTATAVVTATPTVATVNHVELWGLFQNASNAGTNAFNIMVSQSTAADVIVVKAGSWCRVY